MNLLSGVVVTLHHVQLAMPAGREVDARRFYGGLLGLQEIPKPPNLAARGGVWFQAGDRGLHLGVEKDFHPAKKAHPAFQVRALSELRGILIARGVPVVDDEPLPGYQRFYAEDPFGNRLEFLEPDGEMG